MNGHKMMQQAIVLANLTPERRKGLNKHEPAERERHKAK